MPLVTIKMFEGRTLEQKRELVEKITKVICETVDATPDRVSIYIEDLKKDNVAKNGKLLIDQE